MNKRILSALLCFALLLCMAIPVLADGAEAQEDTAAAIKITTVEEFLTFAENCRLDSYSQNLTVSLETDLDLSGTLFEGIPIFSGTFLGNSHTIRGVRIENDGSAQGFFRYLTATAVVEKLNVSGKVVPGGSRSDVGGIAGKNAGTIRTCSFTGSVSGGDTVGGVVGENAVTGMIVECRFAGVLHGNHFVGGIAGENYGVIRSCINSAEINTTAQQNSVEISDITIESMTNSEAVNTTTDIGGIAGTSSGVIRGCENRGNVGYQHMGYNIGGIAGTQSGYIVDCENYAEIRGRKEVGGIVGQMEPVSTIEYTEDTLQILQGQLGTMSGLVSQASGNAQANAGQISGQIGVLKDQAQTAQDALDIMLPDLEEPELPDVDAILAAQNTLSSTITAMPGTLNSIASATEATVSGLTRDLEAISGQLSAMGETINSASENLGGSVTDVSDLDTAETLTGKVEGCTNYGAVLADLNAGGIAGAMAMENDLDILEDWQQIGENSLNFSSEVRAVILDCGNQGTVTGKKQNVGGIVGWQSMGLVENCANTGAVHGNGADYVGGVSGLSSGFLRSSYAKCELWGSTCVGGIAGSGELVTDCRSMVLIHDGKEKIGAILGSAEESDREEEIPIAGNYYLCVSEDMGAIDGISYAGAAEPLELALFLALEDIPELFRRVTVRFLFADGTQQLVTVAPGGALAASKIPEVPQTEGCTGSWEGLEEADLTDIVFDMTFEAVYTAYSRAIQSEQSRENGMPMLLMEGIFTGASSVSVSGTEAVPELAEEEILSEAWSIYAEQCEQLATARFLVADDMNVEKLKLLVREESGAWVQREFSKDGSYLVFSWGESDTGIALVTMKAPVWIWCAAGAGVAVLGLLTVLLCNWKKKQKKEQKVSEEEKL